MPGTLTTTQTAALGTAPEATLPDTTAAGQESAGNEDHKQQDKGAGDANDDPEPTWLPKRLERAKKTAEADVFKALGITNAEEGKKALAKLRELEEATLTEKEKQDKKLQELEDKNKQLLDTVTRMDAENKEKDAEAGLKKIAKKAGVNKDEMEFALFKAQQYIADKFGEAEEVTAKDLAPFFEDLKKSKPHLFVTEVVPVTTGGTGTPPTPPKGGTAPAKKSVLDMTEDEYREHKRSLGLRVR